MTTHIRSVAWLIAALGAAPGANAQQQPPIRQIGGLERTSADSLAFKSVSTVLAMPGGRVMINDGVGRRVVVLDSTLSHVTLAADTTAATANAYGSSFATLIRYRGDSALLIVPSTLSMFVLAPNGSTAHVMAIPRPDEAQRMAEGFGMPAVDPRGRLIYFHGALPGVMTLTLGMTLLENGRPTEIVQRLREHSDPPFAVGKVRSDSGMLLRVDLESRVVDTAAFIQVPKFERDVKVDNDGKLQAIATTPDPLPVIDQWTMLRDGTLAVVRGRDFHIDWIDASGKRTSSARIPFDWTRIDDARKNALIDSTVEFWQKLYDDRGDGRGAARGGSASNGGRAGAGGAGSARPPAAPNIVARPNPNDVTDYVPPFGERSAMTDADDNVWVRTSEMADGRPVYDVVNRRGELIDRVQVPKYRTIAGFGPGVVYLAVAVATGQVHLERARLKN
jgi:hypothetical protein